MQKSKLYTGSGDAGMTSLAGGYRVYKTHPRIEAYGTIDELNAFIGWLITDLTDTDMRELLLFIQTELFAVGSYLATDPTKTGRTQDRPVSDESIRRIEQAIDQIDSELPKIKSFVLPGGSHSAALAHVCRTVCRRAERAIYHLAEATQVEVSFLVFINRLSDLLFVIARREGTQKKAEENLPNNACK